MKSIMCIVVITVISEMCFSQEKATPEDFIQNHQLIICNIIYKCFDLYNMDLLVA